MIMIIFALIFMTGRRTLIGFMVVTSFAFLIAEAQKSCLTWLEECSSNNDNCCDDKKLKCKESKKDNRQYCGIDENSFHSKKQ